jgi:hypothetical protein
LMLIHHCIARAGVSPREAPATRAAGHATSLICCGRSALNYCRRCSLPPTRGSRPMVPAALAAVARGGNRAGGGLSALAVSRTARFLRSSAGRVAETAARSELETNHGA